MEDRNFTSWTEFIILGFSDLPHLWLPILVGFFLIYVVAISGNLLVMSVIYSNSKLHTPMYFFLSNLSFVDICCTSIVFPKVMTSIFLQSTHITLLECLMQLYFSSVMLSTEFFLLAIMSFDRYAAICIPLQYTMIMSQSSCVQLATGAWVLGLAEPIFHTVLVSKFSFCRSRTINHFYCDFTALLKLSCTNTDTIEAMTFVVGFIVVMCSFTLIITSYIKIISEILKIKTARGRRKAFSTCASHLSVVILYCGVLIFVYVRPASTYSVSQSKIFSVVYIGVIPMCNPIIYTLKNEDFKNAIQRRRVRQC